MVNEHSSRSLLELQTRLELKNIDLGKLKTKQSTLRRDYKERVEELKEELRQVVEEKKLLEDKLFTKLADERQATEHAWKQSKISFDADMSKLREEKSELLQLHLEKKKAYDHKETALRDVSLQLSSEVDKLSSQHATSQMLHLTKIDALKVSLATEIARRQELEEHFARVDRNNAAKRLEEEKLRLVAEKEEEAMGILHTAATQIQTRWRGQQARASFAKMKKKRGNKGKVKKK